MQPLAVHLYKDVPVIGRWRPTRTALWRAAFKACTDFCWTSCTRRQVGVRWMQQASLTSPISAQILKLVHLLLNGPQDTCGLKCSLLQTVTDYMPGQWTDAA